MKYRPHPERWGPPGGTCILVVCISVATVGGYLAYQAWHLVMHLIEVARATQVPF